MIEIEEINVGDRIYSMDWSLKVRAWTVTKKTQRQLLVKDMADLKWGRTVQGYSFREFFRSSAEAVANEIAHIDGQIEALNERKRKIIAANLETLPRL